MHNLCLTYRQTPSQYLRLLSDDEPFVSWRKRVGGKVVSYWVWALDSAVAIAAQHEDERKQAKKEADEHAKKVAEAFKIA